MIDKVLKIEYKNLSKPCSECKKSILKCIKKNKFYCPNCGTIYLVNKPIKTKGKIPIKNKKPIKVKNKKKKKPRIKQSNKKKHDYNLYLKSKEWRDKRKDVLARDGNRCIFCFSDNDLHVHHLTYDNFKNEPLSDLVTLCSVCHKGEHLKSKGCYV